MANIIPDLYKIRNGANFLGDIVRKALEAFQSLIPWTADNIASVYGRVIIWAGAGTIPLENLPVQQLTEAITAGGSSVLNCLDVLRNMVVQYRDDDELYFGPGHVLHRGVFKTQTCNDDGTWVSANVGTLTIPAECPTSPGTTSNLEADSWYYVYAKLDVATETPEYRISLTPPVICEGKGPEHPTYNKMRFLGSFRTTAAPDAFIRPFWRASGWVYWTNIAVGPEAPDFDLITAPSAGYAALPGVEDWIPPSADLGIFSYDQQGGGTPSIRSKGDTATTSGYTWDEATETAHAVLPVCTMDTATDAPRATAGIEYDTPDGGDTCAVVGYHESLAVG